MPGEPTPGEPGPLPAELDPLAEHDPALIGPFRVVGRLGQGGMGAVYGVLDDGDRCIAAKVILPEYARDPEFRQRFAAEVDVVRRVRATCTAGYIAADTDAESPWLATEFVPGRTLREHILQFGPLVSDRLAAFAAGSAEALAAIHDAGVVHRDLKPGNIILSPDGPKVLDFGIARSDDTTGEDPASTMATLGWAAPERMSGGGATSAGDVFAWGAMVAYAATGAHPFGAGSPRDLQRRVVHENPDLDDLEGDLLPLVRRALAKNPAVRPSAAEAVDTLLDMSGVTEPERQDVPLSRLLRLLLDATWTGIDAAGHSPALWKAATGGAGAVAAGFGAAAGISTGASSSGVAGGAAASGGAVSSGAAAGAGAGGGVATGTATTGLALKAGGALLAVATVVAGGYAAGRGVSEPEPETTGSPSPTTSSSPAGQEVEFRSMTIRVPEEWEVLDGNDGGEFYLGTEAIQLDTNNPDCEGLDDADLEAANSPCGVIVLYGPERIDYDARSEGNSPFGPVAGLDETASVENRTDVVSCLPAMEYLENAASGAAEGVQEEDLAPVGDRDAYYREWPLSCMPFDYVPPGVEQTETAVYVQRNWYLPESEIFVLDEWATPELPEILEQADFS